VEALMKVILVLLPLALAACSTTSYMRDALPTPPPGPDEAKVIVYRTSSFGGSTNFPVYEILDHEDGRLLGFTETDRFFEIHCPPGKHLFVTWGEDEAFIEADLEGGKTYFIQSFTRFGILSARPGFAPLGRDSEHFPEIEETLSTLQCRELDPEKAAEYEHRKVDHLRKTLASYREGRKNPRFLIPQDGLEELTLPAK
jgi:hypothetical protein